MGHDRYSAGVRLRPRPDHRGGGPPGLRWRRAGRGRPGNGRCPYPAVLPPSPAGRMDGGGRACRRDGSDTRGRGGAPQPGVGRGCRPTDHTPSGAHGPLARSGDHRHRLPPLRPRATPAAGEHRRHPEPGRAADRCRPGSGGARRAARAGWNGRRRHPARRARPGSTTTLQQENAVDRAGSSA